METPGIDSTGLPASPTAEAPALERSAVSLAASTIMAIAASAPGQATALAIGPLIVASAYGGGVAVLLTTAVMLAIALAYQRLNLWEQDTGGAFTWVARAVHPYFGFLVGWTMLAAFVLATISDILPIGPAVLTMLGVADTSSAIGEIISATLLGGAVTATAVYGMRASARFQLIIAAIEYSILAGFCIAGVVVVFIQQREGTVQPSWEWFSLSGVGGEGSLVAGMLLAVYLFAAWDTAIYISEETERPETNPGNAGLIAVAILGVIYTTMIITLQGAAPRSGIEEAGESALVFIAGELVGEPWDKLMALAIVLSILGTTQACLVSAARISYSMGRDRVLPKILGKIDPRRHTPAVATTIFGAAAIVGCWLYVSLSSVAGAFDTALGTVGVLFALFYAATAVTMTWYYRRLLTRSFTDALLVGVLPVAAAAVLAYIAILSIGDLTAASKWTLAGIGAVGVLALIVGAYVRRVPYFRTERETYEP
ncbi:APC family permease [Nocardioides luteus]|uniref:APC family permease n=1 Tax=Nocardioides luteus TaxID=1844 RepID=UPI0018C953A1|nr:APC family permease [Nocardioides luteus]MBG6095830.1 amino acid transporter [Nocardioides luteus]